jgi:hypothetical protein
VSLNGAEKSGLFSFQLFDSGGSMTWSSVILNYGKVKYNSLLILFFLYKKTKNRLFYLSAQLVIYKEIDIVCLIYIIQNTYENPHTFRIS